jgi:hypothetical protein
MGTQTITVQAATESALVDLLLARGLIVLGEGGTKPAAGVLYSPIGEATVGGVPLAGAYALLGLDDVLLNVPAIVSELGTAVYSGPAIRVILGVGNYAPDVPRKIENLRDRLMRAGGCRTTGTNWYSSDPDYAVLYSSWVALGAGIVAANVKVNQMNGSQQNVTQQLALDILTAYVTTMDTYRARARQAIADFNASPGTFQISSINWPNKYVP